MTLTDTHAHLYLDAFDEDRDEMIRRAMDLGVMYMLLPNIDRDSIPALLDLADTYPGHCFPMMGLHPTSVKADYREQLDVVEACFATRTFCAVGEIGIDLYWDKTLQNEQETAFREQIRLAAKYDLPIVIHSRNSFREIVTILEEEKHDTLRGVFHCFSGSPEDALKAIALGFLLGIGGVLTYKKSGLDILVEQTGLEHIILETDAPFLAPVPYRGKRNESSYLLIIAEKLAELKKISIDEVAEVTTGNARKLFNFNVEFGNK